MVAKSNLPFWKTKNMAELSREQWESLCDGCGKCCCIRLEDEDDGSVYVTDVSCHLFNPETCGCKDYTNRKSIVPDCVTLTAATVDQLHWMPETCAYRLVSKGKDLSDWHHLISGSRETIHEAGMSVRNQVESEAKVSDEELPRRIVIWPGEPDYTKKLDSAS
jgi:uncharacterized cysteine cluster protein YcgN (CxxCxxCC family)